MAQKPMPSLPIPRGQAGPGLLAHVLIAKFCDHLPLYRQAEIYARDGDLKHREIVAISALATMGGADMQLETHVTGAFNVGLTESEIVEVIMTLIPYIGFPKALNAIRVVKHVVDSRPPTSSG